MYGSDEAGPGVRVGVPSGLSAGAGQLREAGPARVTESGAAGWAGHGMLEAFPRKFYFDNWHRLVSQISFFCIDLTRLIVSAAHDAGFVCLFLCSSSEMAKSGFCFSRQERLIFNISARIYERKSANDSAEKEE
jgi:hypothetical protein